jgi:putative SOS response-associated peptidase YedK
MESTDLARLRQVAGKQTTRLTHYGRCSIPTTTPNAATSAVHDRMPVILDPESYDLWLDPGMREVSAPSDLLKPFDARLMRCYPVSSRVNSAVHDDAACSAPVELAEAQARLFL